MNEIQGLLLQVLIQLSVIIAAARAGAWLLGKLGQPQVVGEIVAGLMLGPSVLGRLAPDVVAVLFPADATMVFRVLSRRPCFGDCWPSRSMKRWWRRRQSSR